METILVQETDTATLEVLTFALQMEGYRVCGVAEQNENIIDLIRRYHPRLVLLDCWLSHYAGKQVLHWIKAHFPQLPVIAFSCDNQIDEEYHQLGFDGYLKKPFDLDVLYRAIRKYLPHRSRRRKHTVII